MHLGINVTIVGHEARLVTIPALLNMPFCDDQHSNSGRGGLSYNQSDNLVWLEETTMNANVPHIWRVYYYRDNTASPGKLEIAHEKARQYLNRAAMRTSTP